MLTLYYRPTCAFCRRVLAVVDRLALQVEMKDITDSTLEAELIARGGKLQVPYLIDTEQAIEMYESDDIVAHLQKFYNKIKTPTKVRMHISDNACVSCEG